MSHLPKYWESVVYEASHEDVAAGIRQPGWYVVLTRSGSDVAAEGPFVTEELAEARRQELAAEEPSFDELLAGARVRYGLDPLTGKRVSPSGSGKTATG